MAKLTPTKVEKATDEQIAHLGSRARNFKWEFPTEVFNGEIWRIEVPNDKVASMSNSFRNQCQSVYKHRAKTRKGADGAVYVQLLEDRPVDSK
jgi:hypothetical protein